MRIDVVKSLRFVVDENEMRTLLLGLESLAESNEPRFVKDQAIKMQEEISIAIDDLGPNG